MRPKVLFVIAGSGPTSAPLNDYVSAIAPSVDLDCLILDLSGSLAKRAAASFLAIGAIARRARAADIVHVHGHLVFLQALLGTKVFSSRPLVATVYTSGEHLRPALYRVHQVTVPRVDALVYCGFASRDSFALDGAVPRRGVVEVIPHTIPQGLDAAATAPRPPRRPGGEVLVVSRLVDFKRPLEVLAAVAPALRDGALLTFVGEGPLATEITAEASRLGVASAVQLTGVVPRTTVWDLLRRADVFVSMSEVEGLPVACIEALAMGVPVVLSDIPPHRELVGDDYPYLVPLDEPEHVLEHLRSCLHDAAMGTVHPSVTAVVEDLRRRGSPEAFGQRYLDLYRSVMDRGRERNVR